MLDKLKGEAAVNMIGPMMTMMQDSVSDIEPGNDVSQFIEDNMEILFKPKVENDMLDGAAGLLKKLMVNEANNDFRYSLQKLLEFYESFRLFYKDLIERANADKPTLLEEDDEDINEALADKDIEEEPEEKPEEDTTEEELEDNDSD